MKHIKLFESFDDDLISEIRYYLSHLTDKGFELLFYPSNYDVMIRLRKLIKNEDRVIDYNKKYEYFKYDEVEADVDRMLGMIQKIRVIRGKKIISGESIIRKTLHDNGDLFSLHIKITY